MATILSTDPQKFQTACIIISGSSLETVHAKLEKTSRTYHQELLDNADLVILGIKPQMFDKELWSQFSSNLSLKYGCWSDLKNCLASLSDPDLPLDSIMPNNINNSQSTTSLCLYFASKISEDLLAVAKEITDSFWNHC